MIIQEEALKHWIDNFYGYGSWTARFWFIAHEEGGGDLPDEVSDKISYFRSMHPEPRATLCDIRELYRHVAFRWDGPKANSFDNFYDYRFAKNAVQHNVWKNLIAFENGYKNQVAPDPLAYQRNTFAVPEQQREALIRLYPLPSSNNHAWYYAWLDLKQLDFLRSRTLYERHLYKNRMHTLLSNISAHKPEVVLMYGMSNINALKQSVTEYFHGVQFKMIKATNPTATGKQTPQHHRTNLNGTTLLITTQIPTLRHNRIETGFDWEAFGKSVAST